MTEVKKLTNYRLTDCCATCKYRELDREEYNLRFWKCTLDLDGKVLGHEWAAIDTVSYICDSYEVGGR